MLGSDDDVDELSVDGDVLRLGDRVVADRPGHGGAASGRARCTTASTTSWHRLAATTRCGYRRFFSITSLAGLRQEDPAVFERHPRRGQALVQRGPGRRAARSTTRTGSPNPAGYLACLRDLGRPDGVDRHREDPGPRRAAGHRRCPWTAPPGYDALREIGGLFSRPVGPSHAEPRSIEAAASTAAPSSTRHAELKTRRPRPSPSAAELARLRRSIVADIGADHPLLPRCGHLAADPRHVYRFDYLDLTGGRTDRHRRTPSARAPNWPNRCNWSPALAHDGEAAVRIQQLCGAVTAKSVEDCLFYRDARLVTLNEVGGEPSLFGVSAAEFHERAATRARLWPHAMVTLSTHDTKRSEDVQARIGVLSQLADEWADRVERWSQIVLTPDPATDTVPVAERLRCLAGGRRGDPMPCAPGCTRTPRRRSGKPRCTPRGTTRTPNSSPAVHDWVDAVIDGPVSKELTALAARADAHARPTTASARNCWRSPCPASRMSIRAPNCSTTAWSIRTTAGRSTTRCAAPRWRPAPTPRSGWWARALRLRKELPDTFLDGGYRPVPAAAPAAAHLVAFLRGDDVLVAVSRLDASSSPRSAGGTPQ